MSALTRCRKGDRVSFKDASGKLLDGIVLQLSFDSALVGHQDMTHPRTNVGTGTVRRMSPSNSLWVVPFTHIVATSLNTEG
jgi:hypothetical protein